MADTLDVLTIAEARTAVGLGSDTSKDTPLVIAVTAVSRQLDDLCGPIVKRTVTAELHDGDYGTIQLRRRPVYSITTLTEYLNTSGTALTAETNSAKATGNYLHDGTFTRLTSGLIRRRSNGTDIPFACGRHNIEVTYEAGRAADTASVDPKFKQAASMMLRNIWTGEQASGSETFGAFADQEINPLLGPGMLNKVAALLTGEILDGVYVG